jgi:hypothetical protein
MAERIQLVKRESRRDLAGMGVGVAITAMLWLALAAVAHMVA